MKRAVLLSGILFVLLAGTFYVLVNNAWKAMQAPLNTGNEDLIYHLAQGTSVRSLAQDLEDKGLVDKAWYLEVWARWLRPTMHIKAGEYQIAAHATIPDFLDQLEQGKTLQHKLQVLEGVSYRVFLEQLQLLAEKELIEATISPETFVADFQRWTGESHPEGWLYPDTYFVTRGMTDKQLVLNAYQRMKDLLQDEWDRRDQSLPLKTPYEALVLASIVEKESAAQEERATIAGVFIQRLRKGMRLQTDPTVIYGMGERYKGNITKADLRRDTPYNTYTRNGLPPTPIALPGKSAVQAAFNPEDTNALYFVSKGNGRHHFSETYKAHRAAVIKYQLAGNERRYKGDQ